MKTRNKIAIALVSGFVGLGVIGSYMPQDSDVLTRRAIEAGRKERESQAIKARKPADNSYLVASQGANALCWLLQKGDLARDLAQINVYVTECDVAHSEHSVNITSNLDPSSAMQLCNNMVAAMANNGMKFGKNTYGGDWSVKFFSPYSGNRPIARCTLA